MNSQHNPVIVGGLGGSGTRVVAKILEQAGVFMGTQLNPMYDNLLFFVFGSPSRYLWTSAQLKPYFIIFEKLQLGQSLTFSEWIRFVFRLPEKHQRVIYLRNLKYALRYRKMQRPAFQRWGWKNGPNQLFLPQLTQHYPQCFYVHVIRHGMDMAFSRNHRQLELYGHYFKISQSQERPVAQLDFWIKSNQQVLHFCETALAGRHYILSYDALCAHPQKVIAALCDTMQLQSQSSLQTLTDLVKTSTYQHRYQDQDLRIFSDEQLRSVRMMGFTIDTP